MILAHALDLGRDLWRPGYHYKKAGVVLARLGAQAVARVAEKKRAAAKAPPSSETPEDAKVGGAKETVVVGASRSVAEGALVSASSGTGVRDAQGRSLVW